MNVLPLYEYIWYIVLIQKEVGPTSFEKESTLARGKLFGTFGGKNELSDTIISNVFKSRCFKVITLVIRRARHDKLWTSKLVVLCNKTYSFLMLSQAVS